MNHQLSRLAEIYKSRHVKRPQALTAEDPRIAFIRCFLPSDRAAGILDAGCGSGEVAGYLARQQYSNITGIDLFADIQTNGLFTYRKATLENTGLPDDSLHFVYSMGVLNHLEDPAKAFQEFYRVMKTGAPLLFSAHTKYSLFTAERLLYRSFSIMPHLNGACFFSAGQYVRMLRDTGFDVQLVDGYKFIWKPLPLEKAYRKLLKELFGKPMPYKLRRAPAKSGWYRRLRATVGYQLVIAAVKSNLKKKAVS